MTPADSDLPQLAAPARRALAGAGITHLAQLAGWKESDLQRLHGIGPNALQTLRLALEERGLAFLPEER
jgi:predicted flap endonuclease-1-like 5' DNA nuclease